MTAEEAIKIASDFLRSTSRREYYVHEYRFVSLSDKQKSYYEMRNLDIPKDEWCVLFLNTKDKVPNQDVHYTVISVDPITKMAVRSHN